MDLALKRNMMDEPVNRAECTAAAAHVSAYISTSACFVYIWMCVDAVNIEVLSTRHCETVRKVAFSAVLPGTYPNK